MDARRSVVPNGLLPLVILLVDALVELELGLELVHAGWLSLEHEVHIPAGLDVARGVGELFLSEVVDLLEFGAALLEFTAELADEGFDAVLLALGVEDDHGFVFAAHGFWLGWLFGCSLRL